MNNTRKSRGQVGLKATNLQKLMSFEDKMEPMAAGAGSKIEEMD